MLAAHSLAVPVQTAGSLAVSADYRITGSVISTYVTYLILNFSNGLFVQLLLSTFERCRLKDGAYFLSFIICFMLSFLYGKIPHFLNLFCSFLILEF